MFNNRRINRLILIVLVVASVFLFFSCGEPSFIYLPDITITKYGDKSSDTSLFFRVFCKDNDEGCDSEYPTNMSKIKNGPGLLVSYIIVNNRDNSDIILANGENRFETNDSDIISLFKSDFVSISQSGTVFINGQQPIMHTTVNIDTSSTSYPVKLLEESDGKPNGAPVYQYNFSTNATIDTELELKFKEAQSDTVFIFSLSSIYGNKDLRLSIPEPFSNDISYYAVFFASFTSGYGVFSTSIFSELSYIGTIKLQ